MMAGAKKATKTAARFGEDTRAAVLTISDGCFHGAREDRSGPAVVELLEAAGAAVVVTETLPDVLELIAAALGGPSGCARRGCGRRRWRR